MGRTPKPAAQRRRRNKVAAPQKLGAAARVKAPVLPGADAMLASTRDYWATIWRSPMAAVWLEADVPALVRLATLIETVALGAAPMMVLAEIRNLEDRFGLSPMARRRLQWEIDMSSGPPAMSQDAEPDPEDEDRWLRVVSA